MTFQQVAEEVDILFSKTAQPTDDFKDYMKTIKKVKKGKRAHYLTTVRQIRTKM
jgi:hypothetical protein